MNKDAEETFREKAPLIEPDRLAKLIVTEIFTDELCSVAESVWLFGSFTNPGKEIDQNAYGWSDLDVFVVVPDWEHSQAATNMLFYEPSEPDPPGAMQDVDGEDWSDNLAGPKEWTGHITDVWEQIPDYAKETLRQGTQQGFFRNAEEKEAGKVRYYDIFIGTETQLEDQRARGQEPGSGMPGFCIWERD